MKTLAFLIAIASAVYWFGLRGGCGTSGALACPDPALEEGVGLTLKATEVCRKSGYLCAGRKTFQVARWQLDKGKLRVRVRLPDFVDEETGIRLRDAAIEGIMEWDGHPFPLIVDSGEFTLRTWDIGSLWTQGLYNEAAGLLRQRGDIDGKRYVFAVEGLTIAVPQIKKGGPLVITPTSDPAALMAQVQAQVAGQEMGPELLERVKATAMHEMGHALGLMHSDSKKDIMFPQFRPGETEVRASERDFLTVEKLYGLPNGAMVK